VRSRWEALHAGLLQSIGSSSAAEMFEVVRPRFEALARFAGPGPVVEYLAHTGGDLDEKDRVLAALVEAARDPASRRLSHALLLLCLWPGLDAVFRHRLHLFLDQPYELGAELVDRFTAQVRRIDLRRVRRPAATLVRNTEREVVQARMRELSAAARSTVLSHNAAGPPSPEPGLSPFGLRSTDSDDESVEALSAWLKREVGRDADLVVEAVIHKRDRRQLATSLGISDVALRKRLERALARARRALTVDSHSQGREAPAVGRP
jgi:hypothetical protein